MATILIVDDEFGLAEVLEGILGDAGHRVLRAANGQLGLALLRAERIDLVLLDFMMPVLDGPGLLAVLLADEALRRIPVIMMSAVPEATLRAQTSGYRAFLRKPFTTDQLHRALEQLLPPAP